MRVSRFELIAKSSFYLTALVPPVTRAIVYVSGLRGWKGTRTGYCPPPQHLGMEWNGMSVLVGLGSGVMVGVYPSLLSDELGAEQLGRTYPVSLTLAGLINLAGPPALAQVPHL
jgi:hypothetical protein